MAHCTTVKWKKSEVEPLLSQALTVIGNRSGSSEGHRNQRLVVELVGFEGMKDLMTLRGWGTVGELAWLLIHWKSPE